ncbi:Ergochrome cluster transcriptional regulator [Hyphodiscus hymeniophilus]|uniref:Ergochrome cluster transcriptional regulator n=1 Tax=Hyphodiscus hymeniophilus TaxID=353542 RepID=A0A9P6VK58_9HELO|nr:Ergochrome cluster transcriptional regulator [Hyphodiscus hymeniophilus]
MRLSSWPRAGALACVACKKKFTQKSSLIRHLKWCGKPAPTHVRQKACRSCVVSRARCSLERPACSRCASRGEDCKYYVPNGIDSKFENVPRSSTQPQRVPRDPRPQDVLPTLQNLPYLPNGLLGVNDTVLKSPTFQALDSCDASLEEVCAADGSSSCEADTPTTTAGDTPPNPVLSNDWMIPFLSEPSLCDTTPLLAKHSMKTLLRLFRTWPRMIVKGFQLPPIFHPSMATSENALTQPLSNCFAIVRMWDGQSDGASGIVMETVLKETKIIFTNIQTYDEATLVAALQALIIYTILLIFPSHDQHAVPSIDPSIFIGLQQVVYFTAGTGITLQEETDHVVPSWDAWIHVTSKRRVIFSLYLLHWAYSVHHRLPSFNCDELGFMPAPAAKFLWQASTKSDWERLYKRWLAQWDGCESADADMA